MNNLIMIIGLLGPWLLFILGVIVLVWIVKHGRNLIKSGNFILKLFVGFLADFLLMALFGGGFGSAISILVLSVVCTGGIGLIVWFPLAYLTGSLIFYVANKLNGGGTRKENLFSEVRFADEQQSLKNYYEQARNAGMSEAQIEQSLLDSGWEPKVIDKYVGDE